MSPPRHKLNRCLIPGACVLAAALLAACGSGTKSAAHHTCVAGTKAAGISQFESLVGFKVNCADVYDDASPTWSSWDAPWFINSRIQADNWSPFAATAGNQLTITLALIPDAVTNTDWRAAGAAGQYTGYARTLAQNLVKAHMGSAIIRLGAEANGTWEKDQLGGNPTQWHEWAQFWARTVQAMRSVPGARFSFNWCVSNGIRPIPLNAYYPGDKVVDSVGVDVYDQVPNGKGVAGQKRFAYLESEPGGLDDIAAFARSHGKPLTIPEWGLSPSSNQGAGDDAAFVKALARFVASHHVSSQAYFFDGQNATQLRAAPRSIQAYRQLFNPSSGTAVAKQ